MKENSHWFPLQLASSSYATALAGAKHLARQLRDHHGVLHHLHVHGADLRAEVELRGGLESGASGTGNAQETGCPRLSNNLISFQLFFLQNIIAPILDLVLPARCF